MGFVTFASFDDTLSNSHKKNIEKSFFSWEISFRTAVIFFMVCSVVTKWEKNSFGSLDLKENQTFGSFDTCKMCYSISGHNKYL